jgi:hypothetical protein
MVSSLTLEIILEDIQSKFELVLEGHDALHKKIDTVYQDLGEKIEMNSFKIDALNQKIDNVAADLSAHRADTEVHRTIYNVKE